MRGLNLGPAGRDGLRITEDLPANPIKRVIFLLEHVALGLQPQRRVLKSCALVLGAAVELFPDGAPVCGGAIPCHGLPQGEEFLLRA